MVDSRHGDNLGGGDGRDVVHSRVVAMNKPAQEPQGYF